MPRNEVIKAVLERRVRRGDYTLRPFPTDRALAHEMKASPVTVRKAIQMLIREGLLEREFNKRPVVKSNVMTSSARPQIAFLAPAFTSSALDPLWQAVEKTGEKLNVAIRPVSYVHWDDPIISEVLHGFCGVFVVSLSERVPGPICENLRNGPVVVLDRNFCEHGIPSIVLSPPRMMQRLLDYLAALGHQTITCLNTHPDEPLIDQRIQQWRLGLAARGLTGRLVNEQVLSGTSPTPRAYRVMRDLLDAGDVGGTAVLCLSEAASIGVLRAMKDRGIQVGQDISLCQVNDEGLSQYMHPRITTLRMPDPCNFIEVAMRQMLEKARPWSGPLLMEPDDLELIIGGSTGPSPTGEEERALGAPRSASDLYCNSGV